MSGRRRAAAAHAANAAEGRWPTRYKTADGKSTEIAPRPAAPQNGSATAIRTTTTISAAGASFANR